MQFRWEYGGKLEMHRLQSSWQIVIFKPDLIPIFFPQNIIDNVQKHSHVITKPFAIEKALF